MIVSVRNTKLGNRSDLDLLLKNFLNPLIQRCLGSMIVFISLPCYYTAEKNYELIFFCLSSARLNNLTHGKPCIDSLCFTRQKR